MPGNQPLEAVSRQRIHQLRYPERHAARAAVARAIKIGQLHPLKACEKCGTEGQTSAHHLAGYEKQYWFLLRWLCGDCHRAEHVAARDRQRLANTHHETMHLGITIPLALWQKLESASREAGYSKSQLVNAAIALHLDTAIPIIRRRGRPLKKINEMEASADGK